MNPQISFLLSQSVDYLRNNHLKTADLFLRQAIKLEPNNVEVLRLLGVLESKRSNFSISLDYFNRALKKTPGSMLLHSNKGNALQGLKRYEEAIAAYDQAILIEPNYAEAYSNKGNALQGLKRYEEAIAAYDQAILIEPNYAEAYSNKGNALQGLKRYEEAIAAYDQAISIEPNYAEAYSNKGNALQALKRYDHALVTCDQAILIEPNYAEAYSNKGNALQGLKRYEEAIAAYDQAILIEPNYAEAYSNKGNALQGLKRYEEAIAAYDQAILIEPNYAEAIYSVGLLSLRMKQFKAGWEKYGWRWKLSHFKSQESITSMPIWNGLRTDKRILAWAEQGIGDQILYGSMFNELKNVAPNLIISVDKKLLTICKRSFPEIEFIDSLHPIPRDSYDEQIPIGDLGRIFRDGIEGFKNSTFPYVAANIEKTSRLKSQIHPLDKYLCGISWRSKNEDIGEDKSIPINFLAPLLSTVNFKFINLQYGDVKSDLEILSEMGDKKINLVEEVDLYDDVDSALSLINSCDLIITSSNSTAHMAGALNKRTILILPFSSGKIWYWHGDEGNSLWYPSVKIFSQARQGDWAEVIERVKIYMESLSFE